MGILLVDYCLNHTSAHRALRYHLLTHNLLLSVFLPSNYQKRAESIKMVRCIFDLLTIVLALLTISQAKADEFSQSMPLPCLFNSTHCSCRHVEDPGNCLRHQVGSYCVVDECSRAGLTCDCSGSKMCERKPCNVWILSEDELLSSLPQGRKVGCRLITSASCLVHDAKVSVPTPQIEEPDFRMVQFGKASDATMFNMSAFVDEDNFISKSYEMHGKWKNANRLTPRHITVRMYETDGEDNLMLCAIYNTYGIADDGLGSMGVSVRITGISGQDLEWVSCDDVGECKGERGNILTGRHLLVSYLADGWCIKPLEWNGNVVSVKFTDVYGMKGIMMQSTAGREEIFNFGGRHGVTGSVDTNGLVQGGESPDILFNLQGIKVPF